MGYATLVTPQRLSYPMTISQQMKHYLLTPLEAELLACYRLLDEQTQDAVAHLVGASVEVDWQNLNTNVGLSLVKGA